MNQTKCQSILSNIVELNESNTDGSWSQDIKERLQTLQACLEEVEKDATRYRKYKANHEIRVGSFRGKYRADDGFRCITDWMDDFDECFDEAVKIKEQQ